MHCESQKITDVYVCDGQSFTDTRGIFTLMWQPELLATYGLPATLVQGMSSFNPFRGTIRGLHAQRAPHAQGKWVRAIRGVLYDVIVDIRPESSTYGQWVGIELTADSRRLVYVPPGCLHGYQTLVDDTELLYFVTAPYCPAAEFGHRYDDPSFNIIWPMGTPTQIHPRDASFPDFVKTLHT